MKNLLKLPLFWIIIFILSGSKVASGQIITSYNETTDVCAQNSYKALVPINTGIDACLLDGNAAMVSVSTWDGRDGGIGWRHANSNSIRNIYFRNQPFVYNGNTYCARGLKDPDVIVGRNDTNKIYAVVAGVLPYLQTATDSSTTTVFNKVILLQYKYRPSDSTFYFVRMCGPYGNGSSSKVCKSPNLDGNSQGDMVLTWHEETDASATLSTTVGDSTVTQSVATKKGNIISVEGRYTQYWTGSNCPSCSCGVARTSVSGIKEDLIGLRNEDKNIWVNFQNPDVSISEQYTSGGSTTAIKSYSFIRLQDQGMGKVDRKLVLVQIKLGSCYTGAHSGYASQNDTAVFPYRYEFDSLKISSAISPPRIASPAEVSSNFPASECSIVIADSTQLVSNSIAYFDSKVWMLGRRKSGMLNSGIPKVLNVTPFVTHYSNYNPSVSYFLDSSGTTYLNVVWEMSNSPHNILEKNVVARLFNNDATPHSPYYGFINKNTYANQGGASVAARKLIGYVGVRKPCVYGFYTHYPSNSNANMGVRAGFSHLQPGIKRFDFVRPNSSATF